jgi:hypothetical protein
MSALSVERHLRFSLGASLGLMALLGCSESSKPAVHGTGGAAALPSTGVDTFTSSTPTTTPPLAESALVELPTATGGAS